MAAKTVVAPMDRIKILYQVSSARFHVTDVPNVAMNIIRTEGMAALWKGNTATMIRVFPYAGIQFMVFDGCKSYIIRHKSIEPRIPVNLNGSSNKKTVRSWGLTAGESLLAGSVAGATSVVATYPLDLIRAQLAVIKKKRGQKNLGFAGLLSKLYGEKVRRHTAVLVSGCCSTMLLLHSYPCLEFLDRMMLDDNRSWISLSLSVCVSMLHSLIHTQIHVHVDEFQMNVPLQGVAGLFRGITPTLLGILPYAGVAFALNDQSKKRIQMTAHREPTTIEKMVCGALAGLVAQTLTYPLEVTRRRIQTLSVVNSKDSATQSLGTGMKATSGDASMMFVMRQLYAEQGIQGFFKGVSMNWIKGPVAFSISFTTYDMMQMLFLTDFEIQMRRK